MVNKKLPVPILGELIYNSKMDAHQDLRDLRPYAGKDGIVRVAVLSFSPGPRGQIARFHPTNAPGVEREVLAHYIKFI
jgi:hypothetical protein